MMFWFCRNCSQSHTHSVKAVTGNKRLVYLSKISNMHLLFIYNPSHDSCHHHEIWIHINTQVRKECLLQLHGTTRFCKNRRITLDDAGDEKKIVPSTLWSIMFDVKGVGSAVYKLMYVIHKRLNAVCVCINKTHTVTLVHLFPFWLCTIKVIQYNVIQIVFQNNIEPSVGWNQSVLHPHRMWRTYVPHLPLVSPFCTKIVIYFILSLSNTNKTKQAFMQLPKITHKIKSLHF